MTRRPPKTTLLTPSFPTPRSTDRRRGFAGDDRRGIGQHPGDDAGDDRQPLRAAIADRHRAPGRRLPRFQYAIGGQRRRQIDQPPAIAALPRRVERNAGESGDRNDGQPRGKRNRPVRPARKSGGEGKSVSVSVDVGGGRISKKKKK